MDPRNSVLGCIVAIFGVSVLSVGLAFAQSQNAAAQQETPQYVSFLDLLPLALDNDDGIKAAKLNHEAALESEQASRSGLYPKADITVNHAEQDDSKPGAANDQYSPRELKLKITQPLWDFGETASSIENAKLSSEQARLGIGAAVNAAILQAAQSYTGLKRAHAQYKISLQAELNMKRQTGLQDYRVARGAAVGSDVLQAKNALASATTGRVAAQGALEASKISFKAKFGMLPENVDFLLPIQVPRSLTPSSLADFENDLFKNGDAMKNSQIAYDRAVISRNKSFASSFLPKFELTAEVNAKDDASGTRGGKTEYIGKVEMTWPLELFGTQFNSHRAALLRGNAAEINYAKSVKGLQDSARTTWIAYQSAQSRVSYVSNQVEIARQFLALAQKEAQTARGQMMLVVNAQNALVNAQKDLENANTDFAMQVFGMLSQVNALSLESLETAAAAEAEAVQEARKQYQERLKKFQDELKKAQEGADNAPSTTGTQ
jgi:adhesin transport system outer membrane protein